MVASGTSAGMDQGQVETIFKSLSEYGRVMGLDSEAMRGSFTAVEQMMNKQQIYAEELKTQLGERFPAAISMMAEAVSRKQGKEVTVPELMDMMKKGLVDSSVLKEFAEIAAERARAGGALDTAKQTSAAQQARFNNAWSKLVERFSEAGFDKLMQEFWKSAAEGLELLQTGAKGLAQVFEMLMRPVLAFISILKETENLMPEMSNEFKVLAGVVALLAFPMTSFATGLALVALAIEDIVYWSQGKKSLFGEFFEGLKPDTQAAVLEFSREFKTLWENIGKLGGMIVEGWKGLFDLFGQAESDNSMIRALTNVLELCNKIIEALDKIKNGVPFTELFNKPKNGQEAAAQAGAAGDDFMSVMSLIPGGNLMSAFYDRFKTNKKENNLSNGLDFMASAGISYSGNKMTSAPIVAGDPSSRKVSIDVNLSADDITKMMGDGTFATYMTHETQNAVKKYFARELGGAGARMLSYE
jgi:tape measure domain-containing protein